MGKILEEKQRLGEIRVQGQSFYNSSPTDGEHETLDEVGMRSLPK